MLHSKRSKGFLTVAAMNAANLQTLKLCLKNCSADAYDTLVKGFHLTPLDQKKNKTTTLAHRRLPKLMRGMKNANLNYEMNLMIFLSVKITFLSIESKMQSKQTSVKERTWNTRSIFWQQIRTIGLWKALRNEEA